MPQFERRRHARMPIERPVKIQCAITGRFLGGRTQNLSTGGALLYIDNASMLVPGQRVKVGVAWTPHDAVLKADKLPTATVIRSLGFGPEQTVAIQFDQPQQLAESA